jgi:glucose-1-phosphate thymidylyltransferase
VKGIVLAGGSGTRLHPLTQVVSKQLLPIYDKPMIFYPISVLMLAGIREILIISTPQDLPLFQKLLGSGSQIGLQFSYAEQLRPSGLAEAFIIGESFIAQELVCLILGDNIFYGAGLSTLLLSAKRALEGATLFGYHVQDPGRYGVVEINNNRIVGIEEKPQIPKSHIAVTGLYMYDNQVSALAKTILPSQRGELEITDLNNLYIRAGRAKIEIFQRGMAWLDTGTCDSLADAGQFVGSLQKRQGTFIACLEEIAYNLGYISQDQLGIIANNYGKSLYGEYLRTILEESCKPI